MTDRLLDAHEAAELLGVKVSWVRTATREGIIPSVPLGRYHRYRRESLDAWVASIETGARDYTPRTVHPQGGVSENGASADQPVAPRFSSARNSGERDG